jgi:hypothetical protein
MGRSARWAPDRKMPHDAAASQPQARPSVASDGSPISRYVFTDVFWLWSEYALLGECAVPSTSVRNADYPPGGTWRSPTAPVTAKFWHSCRAMPFRATAERRSHSIGFLPCLAIRSFENARRSS